MQSYDRKNWNVREDGEFRLITPSHVCAVANGTWDRDNLWCRSRIEHVATGATISQGFGKFFNLGCGPLDLQVTLEDIVNACAKQDAVATLKLDGSLLIRSVYNGQVIFRTRGSFNTDMLDNHWEIETVFKTRYPLLFDPEYFTNESLLFEWISPNNKIVIHYDEPDLILVGSVWHDRMRYRTLDDLFEISGVMGTPLVESFALTTPGWTQLYSTLRSRNDIEGYVIRLNHEQTLVKVKCDPYLTKHALKSNLNTEDLAELYFQLGQPTFQDFVKQFESSYDEEIALWAMPAISALYDGVRKLHAIMAHMRSVVQQRVHQSRKEFAIEMQKAYGHTKKFSAIMQMYSGQQPENKLLKSILLQNTKQVEMGIWSTANDDTVEEPNA